MLVVSNVQVLGLERAIKASGNPMTTGEIDTCPVDTRIDPDFRSYEEFSVLSEKDKNGDIITHWDKIYN